MNSLLSAYHSMRLSLITSEHLQGRSATCEITVSDLDSFVSFLPTPYRTALRKYTQRFLFVTDLSKRIGMIASTPRQSEPRLDDTDLQHLCNLPCLLSIRLLKTYIRKKGEE